MDWPLFASVFWVIFLAELPDKTTLTAVVLSSGRDLRAVFAGAATALVTHSLIAVTLGTLLFRFLPPRPVQLFSGVLFLIFSVLTWRSRKEKDEADLKSEAAESQRFWATAVSSFGLIFLAEWGDLTQLSTIAFAAKFQAAPTIFVAAASALCTVSALGIFLGHTLKKVLPQELLKKLAAAVFASVGIFLLLKS
jgi:putative Ca2+/H+ antiporter (TMEM165/GDT1 family)